MTDLTARWQESEFADQVQVGLGMLGLPVSSERAHEVLDRLNRFDVADDGSGEWQHIVDLLSALIRMLQGAELDEILEHAASNYLEGTFAAIANRLAEDEESGVISRAVASRGVPATAGGGRRRHSSRPSEGMAPLKMHADEIETDVALVRRLLAGQFPHWADLSIEPVVSYGTDHDIYRLGDHLAARLPRIGWATGQATKEAKWLPKLAPHLPLAVPVQVAMGHPAEHYPFEWSVYTWLPGENANRTIDDLDQAAVDLAAFVSALCRIDATGAHPRRPGGRGAPLAELDEQMRRSIAQLGDRIDGDAALRSWEESLKASPWDGEEVWVHGDLLPGNLLVVDGRLSAVIDFGGLNVGDPACDLQPAWNVFAGDSRTRYRAELQVDDAPWLRGRGWALYQAVSALPYYWHTNPGMIRQTSRALARVLADRSS